MRNLLYFLYFWCPENFCFAESYKIKHVKWKQKVPACIFLRFPLLRYANYEGMLSTFQTRKPFLMLKNIYFLYKITCIFLCLEEMKKVKNKTLLTKFVDCAFKLYILWYYLFLMYVDFLDLTRSYATLHFSS